MAQYEETYSYNQSSSSRATFITKTYLHLLGAVLALTALEVIYFQTSFAQNIAANLMENWLWVLGAFMIVSWIASGVAHRVQNKGLQYAALGGFILIQSIIFIPLLAIAQFKLNNVLGPAIFATVTGFLALTFVAFISKKDFSFLGAFLKFLGIFAIITIVSSLLFGFALGSIFFLFMIAFAGAAILYDTSNIIHHYPEDRYVAASLELFSSVALLLWYILSYFMGSDD